jgi:hypothetical protein
MPKEMRERVADTFDAFSEWGSEIEAINQRSLNKVLDKTSSLARSLGWPDYAIKATREYVESVSKLQTQAIEQIVEGWKQQLKSPVAPLGMPSIFGGQSPGAAPNFGAMPEFNPMAPWAFWMQAAQAWQRTWMPEATQRDRSH